MEEENGLTSLNSKMEGRKIKTEETEHLEHDIRAATRKMGVYGCLEVTIGFAGSERVDYITYDTKGIWRCYEIKVSKADFHSTAAKSFVGHYNYYVMPGSLYDAVKDEIPPHIGIYVGGTCVKRAKRQQLSVAVDVLKDSMIRSLYRDSDKLYQSGDEHKINRLKAEAERSRKNESKAHQSYWDLYYAVRKKYGRESLKELLEAKEKEENA